jgi:hypothetical protein
VRAGSRASSRRSRWSERQKRGCTAAPANLIADFCNKIGQKQTLPGFIPMTVSLTKADIRRVAM